MPACYGSRICYVFYNTDPDPKFFSTALIKKSFEAQNGGQVIEHFLFLFRYHD